MGRKEDGICMEGGAGVLPSDTKKKKIRDLPGLRVVAMDREGWVLRSRACRDNLKDKKSKKRKEKGDVPLLLVLACWHDGGRMWGLRLEKYVQPTNVLTKQFFV